MSYFNHVHAKILAFADDLRYEILEYEDCPLTERTKGDILVIADLASLLSEYAKNIERLFNEEITEERFIYNIERITEDEMQSL